MSNHDILDDEEFSPTCFAGMESDEHREVCGEGPHRLIGSDGRLTCVWCDLKFTGEGDGVIATRDAYAKARRRGCVQFGAW